MNRPTMSDMFRWALVPVCAVGVWYAAIITGVVAVSILDSLCPPEQMVSGMCMARWHAVSVDSVAITLAALAAFGTVVSTAAVAPRHRLAVALAMFAGGAAFAAWIAMDGTALGLFLAAAAGGTTGLVLVRKRHGTRLWRSQRVAK